MSDVAERLLHHIGGRSCAHSTVATRVPASPRAGKPPMVTLLIASGLAFGVRVRRAFATLDGGKFAADRAAMLGRERPTRSRARSPDDSTE